MDARGRATLESTITIAGTPVPLLDRARIYVCGITPYDVTHLGHAATYVWVDVLGRVLRHIGVEPEVCRNVTDVDDVLDAAAARAGTDYDWFASVGQFQFENDMTKLNVRAPQHEPRAHRYITHFVQLAHHLVERAAAYVREGTVYFRGADVPARAGIDRERALALAAEFDGRTDDGAKDDPLDVAIWHACGRDRPGWDSPWGRGRPGWHAECVAMSCSVFGVGVDIHAGGADLTFPHHAYHAAMAEALTGVAPYARAWMHAGTVSVGGAKMAKSTGNLVLVSDLVTEHSPAQIRLAVLDRRWDQPWDFEPGVFDTAADRLERLYGAAGRVSASGDAADERIRQLLRSDLDVPSALDVATEAGGSVARKLITVLGLS